MAVPANITKAAAVNASLDQEFIKNFKGDSDRLAEILGIFGVERIAAGTALKMLKVTGTLNNSKTDATTTLPGTGTFSNGSSSGTAYVEGDRSPSTFAPGRPSAGRGVPQDDRRSHQKAGYANAVLKTDARYLSPSAPTSSRSSSPSWTRAPAPPRAGLQAAAAASTPSSATP
ncbi:MAG: hypothetical protein ACLUE1_01425 [Adlercreutzia equolifaciens]